MRLQYEFMHIKTLYMYELMSLCVLILIHSFRSSKYFLNEYCIYLASFDGGSIHYYSVYAKYALFSASYRREVAKMSGGLERAQNKVATDK